MKILVLGSGGREHALVWKISQSKNVKKIYAIPGNGGMTDLAESIDFKGSDIIKIADFAQEEKIDLTVVGPENLLSLGVVDEFRNRNLKIFGPTQKAAAIESSKSFAKEFMKKNNIPSAAYGIFTSPIEAMKYLSESEFPQVIKADGLAAGKGVFIVNNIKEAEESIQAVMLDKKFGKAGEKVVVEDFLEGTEMSFMVISDGKRVVPLASAMDYKKIEEGDKGLNTGGMGAISPSPQISRELFNQVMKTIIMPTIEGMRFDGREFRGVLYAGLMITDKGPMVLEYNVRFGDPETQAVLLRLKSDFVELMEGSVEGNIADVVVEWDDKVSACVVLASKGYPLGYETDKPIKGLERAKAQGVEIFHAGTSVREKTTFTAGGRVLSVCAAQPTLKDTMKTIYDAISFISYDNIYFRNDIGRKKK